MAWKSSFRQNYRTTFSPTVPTSAAGISHVVVDVEAPGGEKWEHLKSGGKQWQLAQDAAYQSHTSRLTELWSLPRPAQGLNTNNNNKVPFLHGSSVILRFSHDRPNRSSSYSSTTFQDTLIFFAKCPSFSTTHSYASNVTFH